MEIKTKFALGDKVWIVHESKAVFFVVNCIMYDGAVYYGESRYDTTIESQCFPTKEALIKHISDNGNESV